MFVGIALASFSLIIDHVGVSINQWGGCCEKYITAVAFLLGLMQGKTEALDFTDRMAVIKEKVVIS